MPKFKVDYNGVNDVQKQLGTKAAKKLQTAVHVDVEQGVEDMAERSFQYAPVDTGALQHSIKASVTRADLMEYTFGSHMPYAQRQEYEHKTRKGYFRRSIFTETPLLEERIRGSIKIRLEGGS